MPKPLAAGDAQIKSMDTGGDKQQSLRSDSVAAVKAAFTEQEPDPRACFHEQFKREVDEYDRDFRKKYHDDFTSTMIFAGLFSAVASAFIIDVQSQIRPDYNKMSFTVLTILLNTTSGIPNNLPPPTFPGPSPSIIQVQSILFASLLSALLAAFLAMLGKQWLNLHVEGSFIDRNRHREQKMRGMITWRFKIVVELLPLTLQASLLLLGYALALYLWDINHKVSFVIIGFTVLGIVLYLMIVVAGTVSKTCPFQTPISIALRAILEFYRKDIEEVFETVRNFFRPTRSQTELPSYGRRLPPPPIASDIDDQDSEVRAELCCILTMFKMTKTPNSVKAIMAYITEIVWDDKIKSVPLLQVYQVLCESLLRDSDGKVHPRPGARDKALWSAKALLHLYNQRCCILPQDITLSNQKDFMNHQALGQHGSDHDFDLRSTFYIVDWTFGVEHDINPWPKLELSASHHCWLAHTLQYRAWNTLRTENRLTKDVEGFLETSLSSRSSPSRVVAHCLFIVHMVAGHRPQPRDLLIRDRSDQITKTVDDIFNDLTAIFGQSTSGFNPSAIKALQLAINLRDRRICARSYSLFRTIMDKAGKTDELWSAARLCLKGAYSASAKSWVEDRDQLLDLGVPQVGDPKQLLEFLHYHMRERLGVGNQPIYHVFSALIVASDEETNRGLAEHDFTDSPLIDTVTEALENKSSTPLQKSTIFILVKLDKHLFGTDEAFKSRGIASRFVIAWSSAIRGFLRDPSPTCGVKKAAVLVLLAIARLPSLRVHLPKEQWALLEHFPLITLHNPPSLQRCLKEKGIFPFLKSITDSRAPSLWLAMLWVMHSHLSPEVRQQVREGTLEIKKESPYDLQTYATMLDSHLNRLEARIAGLDSLDRAVPGLREIHQQTQRAKELLNAIRVQGTGGGRINVSS